MSTDNSLAEVTDCQAAGSNTHSALTLLACLVAGGVAGLVLATSYPFLVLPEHLASLPPTAPADLLQEQYNVQTSQAYWNAGIAFAVVGAAVGLAVGVCAPLHGRLGRRIAAGLAAGVLGAMLGLAGGPIGWWAWNQLGTPDKLGLTAGTVASHVIAWATTGIGIGIGAGAMSGGVVGGLRNATILALAGAVLGLMYVPSVATITAFLPAGYNVVTEMFIPQETVPKIIWTVCFGFLCGAAIIATRIPVREPASAASANAAPVSE